MAWLRRADPGADPVLGAVTVATFVAATVVPGYARWLTPEIANFALVFLGTALWFRPPFRSGPVEGWGRRLGTEPREVLAAFLYGLATFLKPLFNGFLMIPLGISLLARRRVLGAVTTGLVWLITVAGGFGLNHAATGEWNYQGGERRTCYHRYPFQDDHATFEKCQPMTTPVGGILAHAADTGTFLTTLDDFAWGRFGGVLWYYLPGVVCVGALAVRRGDRWRWGLVALALVQGLCWVFLVPFNYVGGGGAFGNRYFMGTYPLLFFALASPLPRGVLIATWAAAGLLLATFYAAPQATLQTMGIHAMGFPLDRVDPERILLIDLPTNSNPHAFGKHFGLDPTCEGRRLRHPCPRYKLYYLDHAFHQREEGCDWVADEAARSNGCFWIRGWETSQFLLQTRRPASSITISLANGSRENHVEVEVDGEVRELDLAGREIGRLELSVEPGLHYDHKGIEGWVHHVRVRSRTGFVSAYQSADGRSADSRNLGVFVHLDVDLEPGECPCR